MEDHVGGILRQQAVVLFGGRGPSGANPRIIMEGPESTLEPRLAGDVRRHPQACGGLGKAKREVDVLGHVVEQEVHRERKVLVIERPCDEKLHREDEVDGQDLPGRKVQQVCRRRIDVDLIKKVVRPHDTGF